MPRHGDRCSPACCWPGVIAGRSQLFPEEFTHRLTSAPARSGTNAGQRGALLASCWPQAPEGASGREPCARKHGDGSKCRNWPGRSAGPRQRIYRPPAQSAPAPWEGPLVSDTTEVFTGTTGTPEESPALFPAPASARGGTGPAGASPEPAGAARSWPDGDGQAGGAGEAAAAPARRRAEGLGGKLLPELQRLAQSLGMTGTGRMRKGELIAAIQQRQGGGTAGSADAGAANAGGRTADGGLDGAAAGDHSFQRSAPAGAGAPRQPEQDTMERQTSTQPGLGSTTSAGGPGGTAGAGGIGGTQPTAPPSAQSSVSVRYPAVSGPVTDGHGAAEPGRSASPARAAASPASLTAAHRSASAAGISAAGTSAALTTAVVTASAVTGAGAATAGAMTRPGRQPTARISTVTRPLTARPGTARPVITRAGTTRAGTTSAGIRARGTTRAGTAAMTAATTGTARAAAGTGTGSATAITTTTGAASAAARPSR